MTATSEALIVAMDAMKDMAAMLTGVKRELVEQGWSEDAAEQIIIISLKGGSK